MGESGEDENDIDQIENQFQTYDESFYDNDEDEFERLARTNTEWNMKNLSDKPIENKGNSKSIEKIHLISIVFSRLVAHLPSELS